MFGFGVPDGCFQCGLGHVVAADTREQIPHFAGRGEIFSLNQRPKKIAKHEPRGIGRFRTIRRGLSGDTFTPADDPVYIRLYQQNAPDFRAFHAGLERCHQLHLNFLQRDLAYSHV